MTTPSKKQSIVLIVWSIAWALAFMASAFVFKGNPAKDWIQAAFFIAAMTFWLFKVQRARHSC